MIPAITNAATFESVMEQIEQPMFLLDVEGENAFVFRATNRRHQQATGLAGPDLVGQRPHDVLPPRVADTVVHNYEHCRATGECASYDETPHFPAGACWWQTTLSPIKDAAGRVTKIIGLSIDITARQERAVAASQQLAQMCQLTEELQVFAASSSQDLRGPFQTMVALLDLVMDGFVDLGDEKMDRLKLCSEIAHDAIRSMNGILAVAQGLQQQGDAEEVADIYHICTGIAALLDPDSHLAIELPRLQAATDSAALQMVLHHMLEAAVGQADRQVSVVAGPGPDGFIQVTVAGDGADRPALLPQGGDAAWRALAGDEHEVGMDAARAIIRAKGGQLEQAQCPFATGTAILFSWPGRVIEQP